MSSSTLAARPRLLLPSALAHTSGESFPELRTFVEVPNNCPEFGERMGGVVHNPRRRHRSVPARHGQHIGTVEP